MEETHHRDFGFKRQLTGIQGFAPWNQDPLGTGHFLQEKRKSRNSWSVDQTLFKTELERVRSRVRTRLLNVGSMVEEVLLEGSQPWE